MSTGGGAGPLVCRLSPGDAPTIDALYAAIAAGLGLPAHFGANLDALWDSLTGDLEGPAEIVIADSAALRARLGPEFDRLVAVLREAERTRPDLVLRLL